MRYPTQQKEQTRQKLVHSASRQFRLHGANGVAVPALMAELNLTHGGFYRHFDSKECLYSAALTSAFAEIEANLQAAAKGRSGLEAVNALIDYYLSSKHCASPADGCPITALSAEIVRSPQTVRLAFDAAVKRFEQTISTLVPGKTPAERTGNLIGLFGGMSGVLSLARAVHDDQLRNQILTSGKRFFKRHFKEAATAST